MIINTILKKIFGTRNERLIKRLQKTVVQINAFEKDIQALSDAELAAKTDEFKKRLGKGESLDALLPEAFAVVREVSVRTLGMRHFDVQMIGGLVLHQGKISEMRTGEGKTLASTLPAYLNALTGQGVHVVTVNDYLAKRDAAWMEPIYSFLGMTVGVNVPGMSAEEKQKAYAADITYGTNNEFGFDYLRDNMAFALDQRVQRHLHFAVVDEVDSILIDEARTPLIISGPSEESSDLYTKIHKLVPLLEKQEAEGDEKGDYVVDEKARNAHLTEQGQERVEQLMIDAGLLSENDSLYDVRNISLLHHLNAALRANNLYQKDVDYIVRGNEVIIVDEHTGRLMPGRRWSDGLHQAVEAKEGVKIQSENQTLASITFQNFFRLYEKLAGMTGTADTEAFEFQEIYALEVVVIPTNKPIVRDDKDDQVYLTIDAKFNAIVENIKERQKAGQPILVGTASIENSELLSGMLDDAGVKHQVLNAKFHEKEAKIIAQAGQPGTVTIATNMAGRGTDIVLGGNVEAEINELENPTEERIAKLREDWKQRHQAVLDAGGLHVLGTERNESRRIDNQLRGRSGRQGDAGSSQYFLSLEDNLMRIFASDRAGSIMKRFGMQDDEAIQNPIISRAIESAQRKVEAHNFDIRKQLLQFDDVANDQRKVIYTQRYDIMLSEDLSNSISELREDVVDAVVEQFIPPESFQEMWDLETLEKALAADFNISLPVKKLFDEDDTFDDDKLRKRLLETMQTNYDAKEKKVGSIVLRQMEKSIMLHTLDQHWKEHLAAMDYLRQGIHLRGYAQKNPVQEYKREAFELFQSMLEEIKYDVISTLCVMDIPREEELAAIEEERKALEDDQIQYQHADFNSMRMSADDQEVATEMQPATFVREQPKVGRNEPCPCGSGKKFKQCHGKIA